jgi:hypothetical protein
MTAFILVVLFISLVVVATLALATSEMYLQLRTLQELVGYNDRPTRINEIVDKLVGSDLEELSISVPGTGPGGILFLSTSCSTCQRIATLFKGQVPSGVSVVVVARSEPEASGWLARVGLTRPNVQLDLDQSISGSYGVEVSPTLILTDGGRFADAFIVPSFRALSASLTGGEVTSLSEP